MRSVPGANFKFEWNPTLGDQGAGDLATYYPGNSYVDYVGADVYDQQWANYPGAAAEFTQLQTETYGLKLSSFAGQQGKPVTLPEWGLGQGAGNNGAPISISGQEVSGGDDPIFINDMAQWIATNHVFEATYFDFSFSALSATLNPNSYKALLSDFGPSSTTTTTTTTPPLSIVATTTSLTVNRSSARYGKEGTTKFTVAVSHSASGSALVLNGGKTLCTATITSGTGTCSLSSTELSVGSYVIDAQFMGSSSFSGSTSSQVIFIVKS
jgi:hypothetical protein